MRAGPLRRGGVDDSLVDDVLVGGVVLVWLAVWWPVAGLVVVWLVLADLLRNRAGRVGNRLLGAGRAASLDAIQLWTSLSTQATALPVKRTA